MVVTRRRAIAWGISRGDPKCRFCDKEPETLDHILSSCQALSFTDYKDRHDQVARQIAKVILERFGIPWKHEWWRNPLPKSFPLTRDGKEGVLLWDPKVPTVERLEHNRPDMIVKLPEGPTAFIEITVCRDDSVVERAIQKEQRYLALARDYAMANHCHPSIFAIAIGTRGVVPKQTVNALQKLQKWGFDIQLSKLQKAAVIGSIQTHMKTIRSSY
jgi:hypothetical protein